ncbi:3-oxoacid CoA-transferase [Cryptosporangium sp. NPDC051539]|uniref:3-oxoacid CoA-transferase n=1 Tax=Cryptosporangium sp. NPDC051539 TaxID=3363962 RepID=UPI0037B95403
MRTKIREDVTEQLAAVLVDGCALAVGGFGLCGNPFGLIELVDRLGVRDLTVVSNNMGLDGVGLGRLIDGDRVSRVIASYVGENSRFARRYLDGSIQVEFAPQGTLAERLRAGGAGKGMGGAMDLVAGARRVIVLTGHVTKTGSPKVVAQCDLPLTGARVVDRIITDRAVFDVTEQQLVLVRRAPGVTTQELVALTGRHSPSTSRRSPHDPGRTLRRRGVHRRVGAHPLRQTRRLVGEPHRPSGARGAGGRRARSG